MQKIKINRNIVVLHLTVLIWGFTGILGSLIAVSALHLVWYRVLIAAVSLLFYFAFRRQNLRVSKKELVSFVLTGALVGLHWVLFFYSIKISTISVALVTLSSVTLFTAILEPIFNKRRIALFDVAVGLVIITGIYVIFQFEARYLIGILSGLACAICASLFSILNGRMVKRSSPTIITFYEMAGAWFWISLYLLLTDGFNEGMLLGSHDTIYLFVLGVLCTAIAYVMGVAVMKELTAFTVALTTNLEPVYGILLALLIFGQKETMSIGFYIGAIMVLTAVFLYPYIKGVLEKRKRLPLQQRNKTATMPYQSDGDCFPKH